MMPDAAIEYARNGDLHLAYQVIGAGDRDVLLLPGGTMPMDSLDKHAKGLTLLRGLQQLGRMILTDPQGVGQSDAGEGAPTPEIEADDLASVLDACHSRDCVVVAGSDACLGAIAYAARRPSRLAALVIVNGFTHLDQFPLEAREAFREIFDGDNTDADMVAFVAPSERDDERWRSWFNAAGRLGASPQAAARRWGAHETADVTSYLSDITVPTLIVHREGNLVVSPRQAHVLVGEIPDARLMMLKGQDNLMYAGDVGDIVDAVLGFAGAAAEGVVGDRVLLTVLFTDIVGSTDHAAEVGDHRWAAVLDVHDSVAERALERHGGTLVKATGDGLLVTFDGPGDALRCAATFRDDLHGLGIEIRSGIHVGEVERRGDDIGGMAVHLAARVMAEAQAGEVLVSGAVPPLMLGSGIGFDDRGERDLKGVPGHWQVLAAQV